MELVSDNVDDQARQCLDNLAAVLDAAGSNMSKGSVYRRKMYAHIQVV